MELPFTVEMRMGLSLSLEVHTLFCHSVDVIINVFCLFLENISRDYVPTGKIHFSLLLFDF